MVCVNHVSPAERKLAIQPLLGRLEESLRLPEASEQQLAAFGLDVFRSVLQGRPEASVHDAIIRLSEGLDADSRKELAERCIEVTLRCDADEDWWLLFRETNFPGGVCGDAQQLLKHLGHPNCGGWIGESLLRRFEELLLHGGQPILKVDDAGSKVLAIKPDSFKQPQRSIHCANRTLAENPAATFSRRHGCCDVGGKPQAGVEGRRCAAMTDSESEARDSENATTLPVATRLSRLTDRYRGYLWTLAYAGLGSGFRNQLDPSDIVQSTLAACSRVTTSVNINGRANNARLAPADSRRGARGRISSPASRPSRHCSRTAGDRCQH
ncbi:MAG UNVERIFIED_CONTAM: hypothetical protein LVR18_22205 [Planctomycetaceae bacterium]|jgi:hypothetical protein